jgi:hypothetical protein
MAGFAPETRESIVTSNHRHEPERDADKQPPSLVSWVMGKVPLWRKDRDGKFKDSWDEYYRVWRGRWTPESKTRKTERSRIISPATQMAVDLTIAEIVEAVLGKDNWFDLPDDISDEQKEDAAQAQALLKEDLYKDGIVRFLIECVQNGALYGQLSGKIVVDVVQEATPQQVQKPQSPLPGQTNPSKAPTVVRSWEERVRVFPVPIEPGQLVVDPSGATDTDAMLGVAHEFPLPLHTVQKRQKDGIYLSSAVVGSGKTDWSTAERGTTGHETQLSGGNDDTVFITEWHGLVPKKLLLAIRAGQNDPLIPLLQNAVSDDDMVEAIVTIANESILLRAIPNPSVMDDRAIISEQFDTVTNRFWGRGIVEKAFNSQKALDAELRARIDSLAWINNPMIAGNLSKLPPRMNLNSWPGKFWGTRGDPKEILQEFRFGDVNQSTFVQAEHLERMVQNATGAQDPASLRNGIRDESAIGSGIAASGIIKRSRRTMYHIETFLQKLLRRILWRKMQFEPERYPQDFEFMVKGAIGIMAREVEMAQQVQMLQYVDRGTPPQLLLLKSIFEQSSSPNKAEMVKSIDQMLQPDPKAQEKAERAEKLQMALAMAQLQESRAKTAKTLADAGLAEAKTTLTKIEADLKDDEIMIEHLRAQLDAEQIDVQQRQVDQNERSLDIQAQKVAQEGRRVNNRE